MIQRQIHVDAGTATEKFIERLQVENKGVTLTQPSCRDHEKTARLFTRLRTEATVSATSSAAVQYFREWERRLGLSQCGIQIMRIRAIDPARV